MRKFYLKCLLMTLFVIPLLGIGFSANAQEDTCNVYMTVSVENIDCYGGTGSASVDVSGGTAPYSYHWNSNWGSMSTSSPDTTGMAAGTYSVTVFDAIGCSAYQTVDIVEPVALDIYVHADSITCNNQMATVTANVMGGTSPYSYMWSDGSSSNMTTAYNTGEYIVTVVDSKGCTATAMNTVFQDYETPQISISSSSTMLDCNNTEILLTATAYCESISWSTGENGGSITIYNSGTYTVTAMGTNGCTSSESIVITEDRVAPNISITSTSTTLDCNNMDVTLTVSGNAETYMWTDGSTSTVTNVYMPGTYMVTAMGINGCTSIASIDITEDRVAPNISITSLSGATMLSCSITQIMLSAEGDAETYSWSNGITSRDLTVDLPGTYTVTGMGANGCTSSATIAITRETDSPVIMVDFTDIICYGETTNATARVTGGTAPYSFMWSNGESSQTLSGISAGQYIVTVVDNGGCSASSSFVVTEPAMIDVYVTPSTTTICSGSSANISANAMGGNPSYMYAWSDGSTTSEIIATPSVSTNYLLTVTDANGCTASQTVMVVVSAPLDVMVNSNDIVCHGGTTNASVVVNGGAEPYTYSWSNATMGATATIGAGYYIVTVTDSNGCSAEYSFTVAEPDLLVLSLSADSLSSSNPTANITAAVTGGNAPYSYQWNNGSTTSSIQVYEAGAYSVTVVDSNGCSATESVTINSEIDTEPPCIGCDPDGIDPFDPTAGISCSTILDIHLSTDNEASTYTHNGSDWDITANDNTGIASIAYTLSGATNTITGLNTTLNGQIFEIGSTTVTWTVVDLYGNFSDCSFTVTVTDNEPPVINAANFDRELTSSNCSFVVPDLTEEIRAVSSDNTTANSDLVITQDLSAGYQITETTMVTVSVSDQYGNVTSTTVVLTIPNTPTIMVNSSNLVCNGGTTEASVFVTGGTAPYTYNWSDGTIGANATIVAGYYIVTVTDSNGCSAEYSFSVTESAVIEASITSTSIQCYGENNGSATVTVTGGTAPYTYNWVDISLQESTVAGLAAGTYSVVITDANGCNVTQSVTINEPELLALSVSADATVLTCANSTANITATVTGGTMPYTYTWSNGSTTSSIMASNAGLYSVTLTDANGCDAMQNITITEDVNAPMLSIVNNSNATTLGCSNTEINLMATGGDAYTWSNGVSTAENVITAAGTYYVTATGTNGCTAYEAITITEVPGLTIAVNSSNIACHGEMAEATVVVNGGTAPYAYSWSNGTTGATATIIAGNYIVTVTDASGCTATEQISVVEPEALEVTLTAGTITCAEPTATITSTTMGGTAPYSYLWSDGSVTDAIYNAIEGVYMVTVVDANGCSANASVVIDGIAGITASVSVVNAQNSDIANGAANVAVVGGVAPYRVRMSQETASYEYVFMENSFVINNLPAATYSLAITDANGCVADLNFVIENICNAVVAEQVTDNGTMLHFENVVYPVTVYVDGNTNGTATEDGYMLQNVENGVHNVFVADANGCFANISVFVEGVNCDNVNIMANVSVTPTTSTTNPNGTAVITAGGGQAPYSFTWSNGNIGDNATDLYQGVYTVVVTDANGCVGTTSFEITYDVPEEEFDELYVTLDYHIEMEQTYTNEGISVIPVAVVYAQAFGGSAPYAYSWMAAGADNGCYFKMYESGSVCVEVRDEQNNAVNGCIYVDVPVVNEEVSNEIVEEVSQAVDSCFDARFVKAQVLEYAIDTVSGDCVVTWELFDVNGNVHNIDVAYPLDSALSGIYAFNLYFTCNGGRLVTSFSVRLYIEVEDGGDPVSVEEIVVSSANAYPNPFTDIINVEIESAVSENVEISVVNLNGQVVYMTNKYLSAGQNSFEINADNYVPGVYFIRINGSEINETLKMVK